jgi:hypothetical protein
MSATIQGFGLLLLTLTIATAGESLGISPAIALIDNVQPGAVIDLGAKGLRYAVHNQGGPEQSFVMEAVSPPYSLKAFEAGFEPLPDASWLTLQEPNLTAPANGTAASGVTLRIPDAPEYWNRHYVVYVEVGVGKKVALGATLKVRARLLIETATRPADAAAATTIIAITPGRIDMTTDAGKGWHGTATVRNQGPAATFDVLTMAMVYPDTMADRRSRFFPGYVTTLDEQQVSVDVSSFTLASGEQRSVKVSTTSAVTVVDKPVDVVRFIGRRAPVDATDVREVNGQRYDRIELLRLRHNVQETVQAP